MMNRFFQTIRSMPPGLWTAGRVVGISLGVTVALAGIRQVGGLQSLELGAFDQVMRLKPDEGPDARLLIVGVTEEDIQAEQGYPLSDQTIATLLDKLSQADPRAIGLDIIRDVPIKAGQAELLDVLKQDDRIVAVCRTNDQAQSRNSTGFPPPPGIPTEQIGFANLGVDSDGVVRRGFLSITPPPRSNSSQVQSICNDATNPVPSLALQLALRYLDVQGIGLESTPDQRLKLGSVILEPLAQNTGPYRQATIGGRQGYQFLLNYRSEQNVAQQVSLTDVLQGKVPPEQIKDRVVLIGYTARSVHDEFFTPYGQGQTPPMPGVVIHAQLVSQILSTVLDQRPQIWFWPQWAEVLWIGVWSIAGGLLAWRIRHPLYLSFAGGGALAVLFGIALGLFTLAGWIPLVPPAIALLVTIGGVVMVDRGYAQAIVQGVKGFLKLDIEIDEAKKEQEVAEIEQSSYFQELRSKSQDLRKQRELRQQAEGSPLPDPLVSSRQHSAISDRQALDSLQSSHRNSAQPAADRFPAPALEPWLIHSHTPQPTPEPPAQPMAEAAAMDYLTHLQNRGQQLKQQSSHPAQSRSSDQSTPPLAPLDLATLTVTDSLKSPSWQSSLPEVPQSSEMPTATPQPLPDRDPSVNSSSPIATSPPTPTESSPATVSVLQQAVEDYYHQLRQRHPT